MSIEREGSLVRFTCDGRGCRANYEVHDEPFAAAWAEARRVGGWCNTEHRGVWSHYCRKHGKELGED